MSQGDIDVNHFDLTDHNMRSPEANPLLRLNQMQLERSKTEFVSPYKSIAIQSNGLDFEDYQSEEYGQV